MALVKRTAGSLFFWLVIVVLCGVLGWFIAVREQKGPPERATAVFAAAAGSGESEKGKDAPDQ